MACCMDQEVPVQEALEESTDYGALLSSQAQTPESTFATDDWQDWPSQRLTQLVQQTAARERHRQHNSLNGSRSGSEEKNCNELWISATMLGRRLRRSSELGSLNVGSTSRNLSISASWSGMSNVPAIASVIVCHQGRSSGRTEPAHVVDHDESQCRAIETTASRLATHRLETTEQSRQSRDRC